MALLDYIKENVGDEPTQADAVKFLRGQFPEFKALSDTDFASTMANADASASFLNAYDPTKAIVTPANKTAPETVPASAAAPSTSVVARFRKDTGFTDPIPDDILEGVLRKDRPDLFKGEPPAPGLADRAASVVSSGVDAVKGAAAPAASIAAVVGRQIDKIYAPVVPDSVMRLAEANASGSARSLAEISGMAKNGMLPFSKEASAAFTPALTVAAQKLLPSGPLSKTEKFLSGDKSVALDAVAPTQPEIESESAVTGKLPLFDIARRTVADTLAPLIPNPLNPVETAMLATFPAAVHMALEPAAAEAGLSSVSPVLRAYAQTGLIGGIFTAVAAPEDAPLGERAKLFAHGAAGGIVLHGAGAGIDEAFQALGAGNVKAYAGLRQAVVDHFVERGVDPKLATQWTDWGLDQVAKTGGGWEGVSKADITAAREVVEKATQRIRDAGDIPLVPERAQVQASVAPAEAPVTAVSPNSFPGPGQDVAVRQEMTMVDGTILGGPDGVRSLTARLPALAAEIIGKPLPAAPDTIIEAIDQAETVKRTALQTGAEPIDAELAATKAFGDYLKQVEPGSVPRGTSTATPAAHQQAIQGLAESMGLQPFQLNLDQFKAVYGGGRDDAAVAADHTAQVRAAVAAGAEVPPAVADAVALNPQERGRAAAEEVLKANGISDRVAINLVDSIAADDIAFKAGRGREFDPKKEQIAGATTTSPDRLQAVIDLANGATESTGKHEAFHAVTNLVMNDADKQVVLGKYENMEDAADAFADYRQGTGTGDGFVDRVFAKIKAFLERFKNWVNGRGFRNAEDVFSAVESGEFSKARTEYSVGPNDEGDAQEPAGGSTDFSPAELERHGLAGAEGINVTDPSLPLTPEVGRMIRTQARSMRKDAITEIDPLINFVQENGGLKQFEKNTETGVRPESEEFNGNVPSYLRAYAGGTAPDELAQQAFDAKLIDEPTTAALYDRLSRLPRRLPTVSEFHHEAARTVAQEISDWPRVQKNIKSDIGKLSGAIPPSEQKVFTERQALRRSLQRQAAIAVDVQNQTINQTTNLKMQMVEIVKSILPESEHGKFLDAVAKISKPEQVPAFIDRVVGRFEAVNRAGARAADIAQNRDAKALAAHFQELQRTATAAARATTEQLQVLKSDLAQTINESLPQESRGKFINAIAKAKTADDVLDITERINTVAKMSQRDVLVIGIKNDYRRFRALKSIDVDHLRGIDALMGKYLSQIPDETTAQALRSLNDSIAHRKDNAVPAFIVQQLQRFQSKPLGDMEVSELQDISTAMKTLADLGKAQFRLREELDTARKKKDVEDIVAGAVPLQKKDLIKAFRPGEKLSVGDKFANAYRTLRNLGQHMTLSRTPIDYLMDQMDGYQDWNGPVSRIVKGRLDSSFTNYENLRDSYRSEIIKKASDLGMDQASLERIGVFAMDQQEGGREKLLNNGFTDDEIDNVVLTPKEMNFYQFARARLDEMLPRVRQTMKDLYNQDVGSVRSYFPFISNWDLMERAQVIDRLGEQFINTKKKNAEQGFTKERTGPGKQAVVTDALEAYLKHTDDVSYLTTVGRETKYLGELIKNPEVEKAVGSLGQQILAEYIDTMARKGGVESARRFAALDRLRHSLGAAQIAFAPATALVHSTLLANGAATIGSYAFRGTKAIVSPAAREFLSKNFPETRDGGYNDPSYLEFAGESAYDKTVRVGHWPLKKLIQLASDSITLGAYMKYMDEHDLPVDYENPNAKAIQRAQLDRRRALGSSSYKDIPLATSRGKLTGNVSLDRAFFQYQNYALANWARFAHDFWDAGVKKGRIGRPSGVIFWLVLSAIMEETIRKGTQNAINSLTGDTGNKKEAPLGQQVAMEAAGMVPYLGSVVNSIAYDRMPVPVFQAIADLGVGVHEAMGKKPETREKGAIRLAGALGRGVPFAAFIPGFPSIPGTVTMEKLALKMVKPSRRGSAGAFNF